MLLFVAYLLWQLSIEAVVRAQELSELRSCVKVELAVLGSRP